MSKLPELYQSCISQSGDRQKTKEVAEPQRRTRREEHIEKPYIIRHWNGELTLAKSLWVNTGLSILFFILIFFWWSEIISFASARYSRGGAWTVLVSTLFLAGITMIWQVVGTWRSATSSGSKAGYSILTKSFIIIYVVAFSPTYLFFVTNIGSISASDFKLRHFEVTTSESTIFIHGVLEAGISNKFISEIRNNPSISLVALDSTGGFVSEAERIIKIIEDNSLSTVITGECLSACTRIFAAGKNRIMLTNSNIGFHSPKYLFSNNLIDALEIQQFYEHLTSKGFPTEFIDGIRATPAEEMWYAPTMPLFRSGFITNLSKNLSDVEATLGSGDIVQQKPDYEETTLQQSDVVSVTLGAEEILFPIPAGLIAFQSGEYHFELFKATVTGENKLLLVLARESDIFNPEFEVEGFKIYAKIEYLELGRKVNRNMFEEVKEFMASNYEDVLSSLDEKTQTVLDKASQKLSQTTETDFRVQGITVKPIRIIENNNDYLMIEMMLHGQMQTDGVTHNTEQNVIQIMSFMNEKIIQITWYANRQPEKLPIDMLIYAKYFVEKMIQLNNSSNS